MLMHAGIYPTAGGGGMGTDIMVRILILYIFFAFSNIRFSTTNSDIINYVADIQNPTFITHIQVVNIWVAK